MHEFFVYLFQIRLNFEKLVYFVRDRFAHITDNISLRIL